MKCPNCGADVERGCDLEELEDLIVQFALRKVSFAKIKQVAREIESQRKGECDVNLQEGGRE